MEETLSVDITPSNTDSDSKTEEQQLTDNMTQLDPKKAAIAAAIARVKARKAAQSQQMSFEE